MMKQLLCTAFMLLGLTACGAGSVTGVLTPQNNCREITLAGNPPRPTSSKLTAQAFSCLVESFRVCSAKTLTLRQPETGGVRTFTIVPGPSCGLSETLQTDANAQPATADCKGVRIENGSLVIEGCSHLGDFRLTP